MSHKLSFNFYSLPCVSNEMIFQCFVTEAGHALVGALMPEYDPVAKISIIPRGQAGGLTFFAPSEERLESGLYSRSYLENQMAVALGGRLERRARIFPTKLLQLFCTSSLHPSTMYFCCISGWQKR